MAHRQTAEPERTDLKAALPTEDDQAWDWGKMLSMDGGMVNMRQEGWQALKVGLIGHVVSDDPSDSRVIPEVHTLPLVYTAVLGDVEAFTPVLVQAAQAHGIFEATPSRIPADGATWIWGIADRHFPQSTPIVDGSPARQHLAEAAQARFPDCPQQATAWFQAQTDVLFEGALNPLLTELNQAGLAEFAHYFETHQARMRYLDFQAVGLPIGSGSVASEVSSSSND